jgi:hypothetical protein
MEGLISFTDALKHQATAKAGRLLPNIRAKSYTNTQEVPRSKLCQETNCLA